MINSEKLKDERYNLKLSQKDICKILNISISAYARYENETDNFPIKQLINTADILSLSIDYLFDQVNFKLYISSKNSYNIAKSQNRIKELRNEKKLTQKQLSEIINTDRSTIAKYESGKSLIATPFLYAICKKYNISADYLLGKIDEPKYLK